MNTADTRLQSDQPVLVTGGAGYIGSHAVLALREIGCPVVVVDDLSVGRRDAVPDDVAFVQADIGDQPAIQAVMAEHKVGAVMHLAAHVGVAESLSEPEACHRVNSEATADLIRVATDCGVRHFVFSSTASVYGMLQATPVDEEAPLAPITPYGASKAEAERALRDAARGHDFRYVVLRLFNVAGADPALRTGPLAGGSTPRLVDAACEAAVGLRDGISVFGDRLATPDGTCVRDYVHVADVAEAHVAALRSLERGGPSLVLNCGTGRGTSVREVVAAVEAQAGAPLKVHNGPPRQGDPVELVADTRRIRESLGWSPRHGGLDTIISTTLSWLRSQAREGCGPGT